MQRPVVIKKNKWRSASPSSTRSDPRVLQEGGNEKEPGREPRVRCVRDGGLIKRIIVTCTCGEEVEIACLYGEPGDGGSEESLLEEKR